MSIVIGFGAFLLAVVWLVTIADLVRRHLGTQRTVAWLLIVLILPFAGAAFYWVMRRPGEADGRRAHSPPAS